MVTPVGAVFENLIATFWLIVNLLLKCMTSFSHHSLIPSFASLGGWWEDLKVSIRRACVDFSVQKRKRLNRDHDLLTKQLIRAKQLVFSGDSRFLDTVNDLETKLSSLINKSCEGVKIRSRARWLEEG